MVVSVVLDQLSADTLERLLPHLPEDGLLRRMAREGTYHTRVRTPYAATLTSTGHTTIYTGRTPRETGIVVNRTLDRDTGDYVTPLDDGEHAVIGAPSHHAAPTAIVGDTIADALHRATEGRAQVFSVSLKDRGAIPGAGREGGLAVWYDKRAGGFTTSTYYAEAFPPWFAAWQRHHPLDSGLGTWRPERPRVLAALGADLVEGEGDWAGLGVTFPHEPRASRSPTGVFRATPAATRMQVSLAEAAAGALGMGVDEHPDLLAISISATDYSGHMFGPESWEFIDNLIVADLELAKLVRRLSRRAEVAVLVTSDHGAPPLPERMGTSPRLHGDDLAGALERHLDAELGDGDWVLGFSDVYLFFTRAALERRAEVAALALPFIESRPYVHAVYDVAALPNEAPTDALDRAVWLAVHPERSGDLYVVPTERHIFDPGYLRHSGTHHGSPWDYDREVPVLMWGAGVSHGVSDDASLSTLRIAPTISAMLGVPAPEGASAEPLPGLRR